MPIDRASSSSRTASSTHARSLSSYVVFAALSWSSPGRRPAIFSRIASSNRSTRAEASSSASLGTTIPGSQNLVIHAHARLTTARATMMPCQIHRRAPSGSSSDDSSRALKRAIDAATQSDGKTTIHHATPRHAARSFTRLASTESSPRIVRSFVRSSESDATTRESVGPFVRPSVHPSSALETSARTGRR